MTPAPFASLPLPADRRILPAVTTRNTAEIVADLRSIADRIVVYHERQDQRFAEAMRRAADRLVELEGQPRPADFVPPDALTFAPIDWDHESFCVEQNCFNPATHSRLIDFASDIYEMVCCAHSHGQRS